jgi:hypothetical protein
VGVHPPTLNRLGGFFHRDGMRARKRPLPLYVHSSMYVFYFLIMKTLITQLPKNLREHKFAKQNAPIPDTKEYKCQHNSFLFSFLFPAQNLLSWKNILGSSKVTILLQTVCNWMDSEKSPPLPSIGEALH